jgi:hypothetical protein
MYKKIIVLVIFMFLGISCFFKLDKVDNKGDVNIQLRYTESNTIDLSSTDRAVTIGETIEVILTNIADGREFSAIATRTQESQEMYFASIPYGVYTVTIRLIKPEETEPYSVITNQLVVGSSVATFTGIIGAPNKISDTGRIGLIYYFEGFEDFGFGDEFYYAIFTFNPVSSNLINPTISEEELDYISYNFYFGTSPVLGESDLKISNLGNEYYRESSNSAIDFVRSDGFEDNIIQKSEFSEFVKGQTYYWKVVAKNSEGSVESSTLPVLILAFNYKTYQDNIYTPYDDQEIDYANLSNDLEFGFFPFTDLNGKYNL